MRKLQLILGTAIAIFALGGVTCVPAMAEGHAPLFIDSNGALVATRPGYYLGYVNGAAQSNAKQPIKHVKAGYVVGKLPKVPGEAQGSWRLNGSDAIGSPNMLRQHRRISLYQGGYVSFSVNGLDPSTPVTVYLISNANPYAAVLVGALTADARGDVALTTLPLPASVSGNTTVEIVGELQGTSTVIAVGARVR